MRKRIILGLSIGIIAGMVDVTPMILQKLAWDADLSAFSMWVIIGFFISVTDIKVKGFLKGLIISYLLIIPVLIIVGGNEPKTLIPIVIMTTFLGAASGFAFEKINSRSK